MRCLPRRVARTADNDSWCISFGSINNYYADIDFFDDGEVFASHIGGGQPSKAYEINKNSEAYREWLRFAIAYTKTSKA